MAKRGLVWFKNDLRVHDNEALVTANKECKELVFCYCVEKAGFQKLELGFRRADVNRFKFMQQSVLNLRDNLEQLGGHLMIGKNSALDTLPDLVKAYVITDIYAEQEYAPYELALVDQVIEALPDVRFSFFLGQDAVP